MTGQELRHELTERWSDWPESLPYLDVYISTTEGLSRLVALDYDKKDRRIVMIPEAKNIGTHRRKNRAGGRGDKIATA